jgi:hypothetical protein
MQEFKKSIFKGFKFSMRDFLCVGSNPTSNMMTRAELDSAVQMNKVCAELISELGGITVSNNVTASHIVMF